MNRFTPAVPVVLAMSAWSVAALAADEPPSAPAPAAAAAATAASATSSATPTTQAQNQPSAASSADRSVERMVCLNMSLQCFAMKPEAGDSPAKLRTSSLDLKAPDIRRLVPEVELRQPLEEPEVDIQQVQVESTRPEVYVPAGIASLPWAVMHPTQAWRILLPVPPGVAK